MKYDDFLVWLQDSNDMSIRSAKDVVSRSKRVLGVTGQKKIDEKTQFLLVESQAYLESSTFVRSQLKRAIALYLAFLDKNSTKE